MKSKTVFFKGLKKAVSLILTLTLTLTLFAGVGVLAEDGELLILNPGSRATTANFTISKNVWYDEYPDKPILTITPDAAGAGFSTGVTMSSSKVIGVQAGMGTYDIYLKPDTVVNAENDLFMMYVKFPKYITDNLPSDRCWGELIRFLGLNITQNGTTYSTSTFAGVSYTYLDVASDAWQSGTFEVSSVKSALSGFEGYFTLDLSTLSDFSSWVEAGFDADADYTVSQLYLHNSVMGGECGDFAVGGYYGVETYSASALSAQMTDTSAVYSLSAADSDAIRADELIDNSTAFNFQNNVWLGTDDAWGGIASQTTITTGDASSPIGDNDSIIISSPIAEGYHNSVGATYQQIVLNTKVKCNQGSAALMLYLELPRNDEKGVSSLRISECTYDGYAWQSFYERADCYDYLPADGTEWVTGNDTDGNNQMNFPNGFKGYVKIYLDGGTNASGSGLNLSLWKMGFRFGAYGEGYGDVVIGGVWDITQNSNSTDIIVNEIVGQDSSSQPIYTASALQPMTDPAIIACREAPMYPDHNGISIGASAPRGEFTGDSLGFEWRVAKTNEPMRNVNAMELLGMELGSDTAVGSNIGVSSPTAVAVTYGKVVAGVNTFMMYIEVPKNVEGSDWSVAIDGFQIYQGNQAYYSGGNNMVYSYIGVTDTSWTYTMTDANEHMLLPSGFKGYIRFDITAMSGYSDWLTNSARYATLFDTSADCGINRIDFKFGSLGGEYGSFIVGGLYNITHNSNSIFAKTTCWVYPSEVSACLSLYENSDKALAGTVKTLITEIGEPTLTDSELVEQLSSALSKMSAEALSLLTAEEIASTEAIITAFKTYSPILNGASLTVAENGTLAGISVNTSLDITAAAADGYSVSEYGTLMISDKYYSGNGSYDEDTVGAHLILENDIREGTTSFMWDAIYDTNNRNNFESDIYFRSFVTYTNGSEEITVWNSYYTDSEATLPYIVTSINAVAEAEGASLPAKPLYGDVNADSAVDATDLTALRKFLLGSDTGIDELLADVAIDGTIDIIDLIRLKKYLAGTDVLLGAEDKDYFYFGDINETVELSFNGTSSNSLLLRTNPDRGWRLEAYVNVANTSDDKQTVQDDPTFNVWNNLSKEPYQEFTPQLTQVYFYLTGYKNAEALPQYAFDRMQAVFDKAEELGIKLVVRFVYQGDMAGTGEAEDAIMLAHMKQLKPLLEKNKELINVVEAGFLGAWGEWHSYGKSGMEHDTKALLEGIVDMVPDDLYIQIRYPQLLDIIDETSPAYDDLSRIGIHNDSFFGYRYCSSAWPMNPAQEDGTWDETDKYNWNYALEKAAVTPMGGELFWGYEIDESQMVDAYDALIQYSMFRQNIFSLYHGYKEDHYSDEGTAIYSMQDWEATPVTAEWLEENNITYDPEYFVDENGNTIERNVLEFITDHLGYRIALTDASVNSSFEKGGEINIDLDLVNYGFSAAYNMQSGLAVLDENGNVISEVSAGTPSTWNSRNAADWNDGTLLTHSISSTLTLPETAGSYKLAFFLKNSAGTGAQLANDLEYIEGGYTVIYEFEIADTENIGETILNFDTGMDLYGERAINILGDSISQGLDSQRFYDQSWSSLFKGALNQSLGTNNLGFVSLNCSYNNGAMREIHSVNPLTSNWVKKSGWEEGSVPGNVSYVSYSTEEEILEISLNRKADGIDRHINGFYLHYAKGPAYYKFEVYINGEYITAVNCNAEAVNTYARSPYIAIPDSCGDEISIQIVKPASDSYTQIKVGGVSYRENPTDTVTVNNYSLSGVRLCEYSDELITKLAKANVVILTLGTNDAGTNAAIATFRHKLDVLVEACKANGSTLIVGDVIWARNGSVDWATPYQNALYAASVRANGYYVDFTTIPQVLEGADDICHPAVKGHRLIAQKLCNFLGLELK